MTGAAEIVDEAGIVRLVDAFYARVRRDPALGPVFDAAIAPAEWPVHLAKMYAFWSSVMLGSGRYKGNPVAVHAAVAGLAPELFPRWLDLFEVTAAELFAPAAAQRFADKARTIAESLRSALFFRLDRPWAGDLRARPPLDASARDA